MRNDSYVISIEDLWILYVVLVSKIGLESVIMRCIANGTDTARSVVREAILDDFEGWADEDINESGMDPYEWVATMVAKTENTGVAGNVRSKFFASVAAIAYDGKVKHE